MWRETCISGIVSGSCEREVKSCTLLWIRYMQKIVIITEERNGERGRRSEAERTVMLMRGES